MAWGTASLTLRANAVQVVLPDLNYNGSSATVPAGDKLFAPAPLVEGALGVYGGCRRAARAWIFSGSAQLLPTDQIDNLSVDSSARHDRRASRSGLGYGARVGILRETGPAAGVSVSVMRRDIPRITYGDVPAGDRTATASISMPPTSGSSRASSFCILDVAAGLGWDKYTGDAHHPVPRSDHRSCRSPRCRCELNSSREPGLCQRRPRPVGGAADRRSRLPGRKGSEALDRFRGLRYHEGEVLRRPRPASGLLAPGERAGGHGPRPRPRLARLGAGPAEPARRRGGAPGR